MVEITTERPCHRLAVEALFDLAFGRDRRRRVAYRYRIGVAPIPELCLVALAGGQLVGAVRHGPVLLGAEPALLLGPLATLPAWRGLGVGRALVDAALVRARGRPERAVLLIGDAAYYRRLGFAPVPEGIVVPGEPSSRVLWRVLAAGAPVSGVVRPYALRPAIAAGGGAG